MVPLPKSASNNLQKWFLSPTSRLNFGFITEGKLTIVLITPYSWGSQLVINTMHQQPTRETPLGCSPWRLHRRPLPQQRLDEVHRGCGRSWSVGGKNRSDGARSTSCSRATALASPAHCSVFPASSKDMAATDPRKNQSVVQRGNKRRNWQRVG
jgi:hypothetical protein